MPSQKPFVRSSPAPSSLTRQSDDSSRDRHTGQSSLTLYLTEIALVKLLTPKEEVKLALRIQKGDKKAREEMIKANLRLVVKIARDYDNLGVPLMDLISEGNIGLIKGVERFDPAKGAKLSTYASWWIKQSIKRALANQSKTIRLPIHMVDKISHLRRTALRLYDLFGREPTDDELADELGLTVYRVAEMRLASNRPLSLDAPIGDEDSNTYGEVIEDKNASSPLRNLESQGATRVLRELIATLTPREAGIIRSRFGLDGTTPKNLEEVGVGLGVTRERIRQIQNRALRKLRNLLNKLETPTTDSVISYN